MQFKLLQENMKLNLSYICSSIIVLFSSSPLPNLVEANFANSSVTFILGGVEALYLNNIVSSPLLKNFEIFGCNEGKSISLPPYPREIFGAQMFWKSESEEQCCNKY